MPTKELTRFEQRTVNLLLKQEAVKRGEAFTAGKAIIWMENTPSRERATRWPASIPNKYRLTYILKKCDCFKRTFANNGVSEWVYLGETNAE